MSPQHSPLAVSRLDEEDFKGLESRHPLLRESRYGILAVLPDEASAREVEQILSDTAKSVSERLISLKARLAEVLLAEVTRVWEPAITQAQLEASARAQLLSEFGSLTSVGIAARAGFAGRNRAQVAYRWRTEGRIFGVEHNGELAHPAFQFDSETGEPLPAIQRILDVLEPAGMTSWGIALWFTTPSGLLNGARPVDHLDDVQLVLEAARDVIAEPDF